MNSEIQSFQDELVAAVPRLQRFCRALSRNNADAEDLLQASVEKALRNQQKWQPGTRMSSWLFRIAQNMAIDISRSRTVRGTAVHLDAIAEMPGEDGVRTIEARSDLEQVADGYAKLPADQRAVLNLVVLEGLSYRETADILGVPTGTVMSRLSRARAALAARVSEPSGEK